MDSDLDDRIDEVVAGARLLMAPDFDLVAAARKHETLAQQKGVNLDRLYTLNMLRSYKAWSGYPVSA